MYNYIYVYTFSALLNNYLGFHFIIYPSCFPVFSNAENWKQMPPKRVAEGGGATDNQGYLWTCFCPAESGRTLE